MSKVKYSLLITFPGLKAAYAQQTATGEGSNVKVAVARALDEILSRPNIKGRKFDNFRLSAQRVESGNNLEANDE